MPQAMRRCDVQIPRVCNMEDTGCVLAVSGLLLIFLFALSRRLGRRVGTRLPPGPPGLPLVGNVRDIPPPDEYPFVQVEGIMSQVQ